MLNLNELKEVKIKIVDKLIESGKFNQPTASTYNVRNIDHKQYVQNDSAFQLFYKDQSVTIIVVVNDYDGRYKIKVRCYLDKFKDVSYNLDLKNKTVDQVADAVFNKIMNRVDVLVNGYNEYQIERKRISDALIEKEQKVKDAANQVAKIIPEKLTVKSIHTRSNQVWCMVETPANKIIYLTYDVNCKLIDIKSDNDLSCLLSCY